MKKLKKNNNEIYLLLFKKMNHNTNICYEVEKCENLENILTQCDTEVDYVIDLVFTRYLYSKEQVNHSLFISLLEHDYKQALFWGYELYYSGFQKETMEFLLSIYEKLYNNLQTEDFSKFINQKHNDWLLDNSLDKNLGIIIWNIAMRNYNINPFIENYFSVKCYENVIPQKKSFLRIIDFDIEKYKTYEGKNVLKKSCLYSIHNNLDELFKTSYSDITEQYRLHWLYYSYDCPLWKCRIHKLSGKKNEINKKVEFDDSDKEEEFYKLYNYEPDEQTLELQQKCIGNSCIKQLSIKEFSIKYGGNIKCKKITKQSR